MLSKAQEMKKNEWQILPSIFKLSKKYSFELSYLKSSTCYRIAIQPFCLPTFKCSFKIEHKKKAFHCRCLGPDLQIKKLKNTVTIVLAINN
jgi:hypothetical protein